MKIYFYLWFIGQVIAIEYIIHKGKPSDRLGITIGILLNIPIYIAAYLHIFSK